MVFNIELESLTVPDGGCELQVNSILGEGHPLQTPCKRPGGGGGALLKLAVTVLSLLRVRLQILPEAESQPDHPVKDGPLEGVAVSEADIPAG